jgi:hypothetical protein
MVVVGRQKTESRNYQFPHSLGTTAGEQRKSTARDAYGRPTDTSFPTLRGKRDYWTWKTPFIAVVWTSHQKK